MVMTHIILEALSYNKESNKKPCFFAIRLWLNVQINHPYLLVTNGENKNFQCFMFQLDIYICQMPFFSDELFICLLF